MEKNPTLLCAMQRLWFLREITVTYCHHTEDCGSETLKRYEDAENEDFFFYFHRNSCEWGMGWCLFNDKVSQDATSRLPQISNKRRRLAPIWQKISFGEKTYSVFFMPHQFLIRQAFKAFLMCSGTYKASPNASEFPPTLRQVEVKL